MRGCRFAKKFLGVENDTIRKFFLYFPGRTGYDRGFDDRRLAHAHERDGRAHYRRVESGGESPAFAGSVGRHSRRRDGDKYEFAILYLVFVFYVRLLKRVPDRFVAALLEIVRVVLPDESLANESDERLFSQRPRHIGAHYEVFADFRKAR